jgi:hypothetical protein
MIRREQLTPATRAFRTLVLLACALVGTGCQTFRPQPIDSLRFWDRIETQERNGLRVSVAVLSRDEARKAFGVDLYAKQIQPVWLRIENRSDAPYWFMLHGLDPNYFSTGEAAYKSHHLFRPLTNRRIDDHFERLGVIPAVPPEGQTSGFAFSNVKLGTKEVRIRLLGDRRVEDFHFYVSVPGFRADYHRVEWQELEKRIEFVDLGSDEELFEMLRELPCCTTRENGTGSGDPLNLVIIAPRTGLLSFIRAGWDETEVLTWSSAWRTFRAFFGGEYRYSPMSALYFDGRAQDIGIQKTRDSIHERNHVRLWATRWRYQGENVWIGTITRDIGVYFTTRAWNLTTHAIDPDVDEARNYLVEDLLTTESIRSLALVDGVGKAERSAPHRNLMFAPFWTDGRRAVIRLGRQGEQIDISRIDNFGYYRFGEGIRELEGMRLEGGTIAGPVEGREGRGDAGAARHDDESERAETAGPHQARGGRDSPVAPWATGSRDPGPALRSPCVGSPRYFDIRVIFEPWMPRPPIRPFWSNTKA